MKKTSGLVERNAKQIEGVLGCFDRVVINGTISQVAHAKAMEAQLYKACVRCFEMIEYAKPLADVIHANARAQAKAGGVNIEFIRGKTHRKEALVEAVLAKRGRHPGLVHIIETQEKCMTYKPRRDTRTDKAGLISVPGQCAVYYFYHIDEDYGLMYMRVPTWLPCTMQVYFNMHHYLENQLRLPAFAVRPDLAASVVSQNIGIFANNLWLGSVDFVKIIELPHHGRGSLIRFWNTGCECAKAEHDGN